MFRGELPSAIGKLRELGTCYLTMIAKESTDRDFAHVV